MRKRDLSENTWMLAERPAFRIRRRNRVANFFRFLTGLFTRKSFN